MFVNVFLNGNRNDNIFSLPLPLFGKSFTPNGNQRRVASSFSCSEVFGTTGERIQKMRKQYSIFFTSLVNNGMFTLLHNVRRKPGPQPVFTSGAGVAPSACIQAYTYPV